ASFTGLIDFAVFTLFAAGVPFAVLTCAAAFAALAFAFAAFGFAAMRISLLRGLESEHGRGVPRDHQFLVGRDNPGGHAAARRADPWAVVRVCAVVEIDAEPGGRGADLFTDF